MAKIRKQTKVWVTSNGRQIRICDMPDQMLVGTLKMLQRAGELWRSLKLVALVDGLGSGEEAWAEDGITQVESEPYRVALPTEEGVGSVAKDSMTQKILGDSWRDHVPAREFFDSMQAEAHRRHIWWDDGHVDTVSDLLERAKIVRDNLVRSIEYKAGGSRAGRSAELL